MNFFKLLFAAFLMVCALFQKTKATNCQAIGERSDNSIGFGLGGTTYVVNGGIRLYKDGNLVGEVKDHECTDYFALTSQLPLVFGWAAGCGINNFEYVKKQSS